jgi:Phosphotransferase system, mannose/fructose-specific component IIA
LDELISKNEDKYTGTLVLCDLKGGTPYNSAAFVSQKHKMSLITGMNIPMAITVITSRMEDTTLEELTSLAIEGQSIGVENVDLNFNGGRKHGKLSLNKNR